VIRSFRCPDTKRLFQSERVARFVKGDRIGQHSIRINDQYRVCFRWHEGNAEDVEIVDYD
jgi:hypothetical protein